MSENEEWKLYPFNNNIQVSSLGNLKYTDGSEVKLHIRKGYLRTKLIPVHRIVAQTFVPNPENLPAVNHIDNIKTNNCASNLEWISGANNTRHAAHLFGVFKGANHYSATMDDIQALTVFTCFANPEIRYDKIAKALGTTYSSIAHMANGNSWHVHREIAGYIPKRRSERVKNILLCKECGGHA